MYYPGKNVVTSSGGQIIFVTTTINHLFVKVPSKFNNESNKTKIFDKLLYSIMYINIFDKLLIFGTFIRPHLTYAIKVWWPWREEVFNYYPESRTYMLHKISKKN